MLYVGVDLHKKTISICVVKLESRKRKVVSRKQFLCSDVEGITRFFRELGTCQVVVEATASYDWFVALVEPFAERVVLAHPKKLRVIAQSKNKTDKIDAWTLAEFLALDMIPEAYRPTPRQRQHRVLVRYRYYAQKRTVSVRNKIRHILAGYNADIEELFTARGQSYLKQKEVSEADRFVLNGLVQEWREHCGRLEEGDKQLLKFAAKAPLAEQEARRVLQTFPYAGPVTIDVVLSELGDVQRIRSLKRAGSFAGLAPGFRESAGKRKDQGITKEGPRLLRWAMIQLAWRVATRTAYWGNVFYKLHSRIGKKKAIAAVARRVFCVMVSMLRSGQAYCQPGSATTEGFPRHGKDVQKHAGEVAATTAAKPVQKPKTTKASAKRKPIAAGQPSAVIAAKTTPPRCDRPHPQRRTTGSRRQTQVLREEAAPKKDAGRKPKQPKKLPRASL